jgi:dolichol-phosphate mannosyltransferase
VLLSIVIPVFNEEAVIAATHARVIAVMESIAEPFEIIYIDDGSLDGTADIIAGWADADDRIKLISFSRNFGHQTAITCGMDHAAGDAIVVIDADLQDPPEVIPRMVAKWREGFEVVYGKRSARNGETVLKKMSARAFYRFLHRMSDVEIPTDVGDFRLIDRKVRDILLCIPEHNRYVRGLIAWLGFRQTAVTFERQPRAAGETKYPLRKMLKLAGDGITSFSYKPLRIATTIGISLSVFSFLFFIFIFVSRLFNLQVMEPGFASLMCVMLFFFGIVLIMLGIIGEYIGRIFEEVKGRPLYIIDKKIGEFRKDTPEARRYPPC